ncbi:SDR family oxidoreductase [Streptomyces kanamyceticus]|uniref:NAD-dependent epimerase/dehydratase family protein n=1 Tax=Streptomyces kanamyceticus TaxID=1967 RepID=A0A5J6GIW1_STRKN|nr:NAD(P)H-binding protein [Streptomyces kanamyceticus]QEU95027.1 NAD-dependent epimerase/dehydratase family protein [Streptomyces kanamyceticus]
MIVVTGATGNVGRALVGQLAAERIPVRALTRDPARAHLPEGVETARLDPTEPASLAPLFTGASGLFLNLQATGAGGEHTAALLEAARAGGVRHVVVLSSSIVGDGADETHPLYVAHAALEEAVREAGFDWTFLRPGAFAANSLQWAAQIRAGDTVRGPFADFAGNPIHEADIAAVALRSFLDDTHRGAAHRLTGPEPVTHEETIRAIGRAIGRDLRFVEIPPEEVTPDIFPHVPPAILPELLASFGEFVGRAPEITTTVETVTGSPARTFEQWARDHKDDFRG